MRYMCRSFEGWTLVCDRLLALGLCPKTRGGPRSMDPLGLCSLLICIPMSYDMNEPVKLKASLLLLLPTLLFMPVLLASGFKRLFFTDLLLDSQLAFFALLLHFSLDLSVSLSLSPSPLASSEERHRWGPSFYWPSFCTLCRLGLSQTQRTVRTSW